MKAKKGITFKQYFSPKNINNISRCEIRGIVDDFIIVLLCKNKGTEFYNTININKFNFLVREGIYIEIKPK